MSNSGVFYTPAQLTAMNSAIASANAAQAAGNPAGVISALNSYYSAQTSVRGYATLALQVLNNTGNGAVANQEVKDAIGAANYTPTFQANLALALANQDLADIKSNDNQVPTLAQVATDHAAVFPTFGLSIDDWGGTPFVALGQDFTQGLATPAERSDIQPPSFDNLSAEDVNTSIFNLFSAGFNSSGNLDVTSDISGFATILGLQQLFVSKFPQYAPTLNLDQNQDRSYQVAELQTNMSSDGTYSNYSPSGSPNYSVDVTNPNGISGITAVSVTDSSGHVSNFVLAGGAAPTVLVNANGGSTSAGNAPDAVLINNGGGSVVGGTGQNLLLDLGSGGTIVAGSGANQIFLDGTQDTADLGAGEQATITGAGTADVTGTNVTVTVSDETVDVGANEAVTVLGSGDTIYLGAGDSLTASGANNNIGGQAGDTIVLTGTGGNLASIDGVTASGATITVDSGAEANVAGGDTVVLQGTGDYLGLIGGGYSVSGTGDTINTTANTSFNLSGGGDSVGLGGSGDYLGLLGGGYSVSGTGATVNTWANTSFNLSGGGDTVGLGGTGDYVGLLGGSGYSVTGSSDAIATWANTNFSVAGGGDTLNLGTGNGVLLQGGAYNVTGAYDTLDTGAGTSVNNLSGGGDTVNLGGISEYVGLDSGTGYTINGSYAAINTAASYVGGTINGSGDALTAGGTGDAFNVSGGNDTVAFGAAGDYVGLLGGAGYGVSGSGDNVATWADTGFAVTGNNDGLILGSGDVLGINGGSNVVTMGAQDTLDIAGTGGNTDGLSGSGDTLNLQAGVYANLNGSHDRINGSNDAVWITGNDDPTFGNSDYVDASGGGDFVDGTGDDDAGSAFYGVSGIDGGGGEGYGGYDGYAGFVRGSPGRPFTGIDVIAQYDQAHGYGQAAQGAALAFNRALESAEGQLATSAVTLGDEPPGPKWAGRVITYSFATAPTTGASPISGAIDAQDQAVIEQAIQAWAKASGLAFQEVPGSTKADITFGWGDFQTSASNLIGYTSLQASADQTISGAIVRLEDPAVTPFVRDASGQLEYAGTGATLEQVALHEIGHALGLGDTSDPDSVLYYSLGANNRSLDATDIAAIQQRYPSQQPAATASPPLLRATATFAAQLSTSSLSPPPPPQALVAAQPLH